MLEIIAVYFLTNPLFVVTAIVLVCCWGTDAPKEKPKSPEAYAAEAHRIFMENRTEK